MPLFSIQSDFQRKTRQKLVTRQVLLFYTIGVCLDITATILMIIGSNKGLTVHGMIGYSSLLGMLIDTILLWRHNLKQGSGETSGPGTAPLFTDSIHLVGNSLYYRWIACCNKQNEGLISAGLRAQGTGRRAQGAGDEQSVEK